MAMQRYGAADASLVLFGIPITDFGDTDPAYTIEDLDSRATLKRGIGGTTNRIDSKTRPKRLTVNLMPGSDQVRQILAAEKSGVDATATHRQLGTDEKVVMFDGVLVTRGSMGRGGRTTATDESFIIEFGDSEET